jgi:hypothetical protein
MARKDPRTMAGNPSRARSGRPRAHPWRGAAEADCARPSDVNRYAVSGSSSKHGGLYQSCRRSHGSPTEWIRALTRASSSAPSSGCSTWSPGTNVAMPLQQEIAAGGRAPENKPSLTHSFAPLRSVALAGGRLSSAAEWLRRVLAPASQLQSSLWAAKLTQASRQLPAMN